MNYTKSPEIRSEDFESFGLTQYESQVYLELLKHGSDLVRPLAQKSGVPMGRIYDVLSTLEYKGLVLVDQRRPKTYTARDPKIAIQSLLDLKSQALKDLEDKAKEFEDKLSQIQNPKQSLVIRDIAFEYEKRQVFSYRIAEVEHELLIYLRVDNALPDSKKEMVEDLHDLFSMLISQSVTIQFLLGGVDNDTVLQNPERYIPPAIFGINAVKIKTTDVIMDTFDILDDDRVLLKISDPLDLRETFSLIYVQDGSFARKLKKRFNTLWKNREEITVHHA